MTSTETIEFENSYAHDLAGFYTPLSGRAVPAPSLLKLNQELAEELGLSQSFLKSPDGVAMLAGTHFPPSAKPLAQAYAGHQFGGFSSQLGDGRALLIGELIDQHGKRVDLHLKGSGPTPYSRGGDGKAALGPVLREYLMGEAMHALNIPTSRALAVVTTGEEVMRHSPLPGAVLSRVAASHLRVGTFQYFAARGETEKLRQLTTYAIRRHYPELAGQTDDAFQLLRAVINRQVALVAKWMAIGFIHGVMNTDNVSISGETIDYGPCAFMDRYDPATVFSSIDHGGRYSYGNQPVIAQWNMARFAEALLSLINQDDINLAAEKATAELNTIPELYEKCWQKELSRKLGLLQKEEGDLDLIKELHSTMEGQDVDFTSLFRALATAARGDDAPIQELFNNQDTLDQWLLRWKQRLGREEDADLTKRAEAMDKANPIYIPRNHLVEEALIDAVDQGALDKFDTLMQLLKTPYTLQEDKEKYAEPAPKDAAPHVTYCGT